MSYSRNRRRKALKQQRLLEAAKTAFPKECEVVLKKTGELTTNRLVRILEGHTVLVTDDDGNVTQNNRDRQTRKAERGTRFGFAFAPSPILI